MCRQAPWNDSQSHVNGAEMQNKEMLKWKLTKTIQLPLIYFCYYNKNKLKVTESFFKLKMLIFVMASSMDY